MKRNLMLVAVTMLLAATSCTASGNGANEKTVTSSVKEQLEKAKDERKTVFMIVTDSATNASRLDSIVGSVITEKSNVTAVTMNMDEKANAELVKEYRLTEVEDAFVRKNKNLNKLSAITSYMKENYAQELSLEEVARIFGYSPTYLSRMFQKYAGITYKSYLQNIRLEYAMKDLKGGKYNITETALRSGFSGSKAMARAFRKKYGILPSEYRENG